jgi:hypothetical protein
MPVAENMYEIRVAGVVPDEELRDIGAVTVAPEQVSTTLYGISDQSALYGLLARLLALGLDVVEVRRISAPPMEHQTGSRPAEPQPGPVDAEE